MNSNGRMLTPPHLQNGLDTVLMGPGPFTLFAPNDDAFAAAAKKMGKTKMELQTLPGMKDILM